MSASRYKCSVIFPNSFLVLILCNYYAFYPPLITTKFNNHLWEKIISQMSTPQISLRAFDIYFKINKQKLGLFFFDKWDKIVRKEKIFKSEGKLSNTMQLIKINFKIKFFIFIFVRENVILNLFHFVPEIHRFAKAKSIVHDSSSCHSFSIV